ncbi:unnamed protein product [Prorocentrum cordatum]|uniref:Uncharacterized protein n=1 Tax=Prorocentrum cordatum TaxID=2364126 RepID=A0ABN9U554_9DINO|nr:unnamed protein product [Polarella glacialis]
MPLDAATAARPARDARGSPPRPPRRSRHRRCRWARPRRAPSTAAGRTTRRSRARGPPSSARSGRRTPSGPRGSASWPTCTGPARWESRAVDASSPEELRAAQGRISACLRLAADADAIGDELSEAEVRLRELSRLAADAERARRGCCRRLCCCCCDLCAGTPAENEEAAALLPRDGGERHGQGGEVPSSKARAKAGAVDGILGPGTKCRYHSATWGTYISTEVTCFNPEDGTYDLLVRRHAKVANICPDPSVTESWPPGTPVEYQSSSSHGRLPAVVRSYNPPTAGGSDGTYNLDIRENAPADRIRLRLPS